MPTSGPVEGAQKGLEKVSHELMVRFPERGNTKEEIFTALRSGESRNSCGPCTSGNPSCWWLSSKSGKQEVAELEADVPVVGVKTLHISILLAALTAIKKALERQVLFGDVFKLYA